jgi:two-component system, sensor histidine kinase RegB
MGTIQAQQPAPGLAAPSPSPAAAPGARQHLPWLVKLRWGAVIGQIVTIAFVQAVMQIQLPLLPLAVLIAVEIATNAGLEALRRRDGGTSDRLLAATLALDVMILTGLLFFTGGPFNPFSFLYLVHIALAALVLRSVWTWALVGMSLVCSGGLFYGHVFLNLDTSTPESHLLHMRMHLQGMWIAFAVAASFIVYFLIRVRRTLAERDAALAIERGLAARSERLAALATLSAGAAHELATPLGTIAVAAKELDRLWEARAGAGADDLRQDVRLIRDQVDRCRGILAQMATDAGNPAGEASNAVVASVLVGEALRGLPAAPEVRVQAGADDPVVVVPRRAVTQAVRAVVKNAQEASRAGAVTIAVTVAAAGQGAARGALVRIADTGAGMSPEVLARAGEPFFTTKEPGRGMGLGLFLARTVLDRVGGGIAITSRPGAGTTVDISLPA